MKLIIIFLLIFTIFTDFTSAFATEIDISACESQISCVEADLSSSSKTQQHESDGEGHNCHLGHSHNFIITSPQLGTKPNVSKIYFYYPLYEVGKTLNYFIDINRPPIA